MKKIIFGFILLFSLLLSESCFGQPKKKTNPKDNPSLLPTQVDSNKVKMDSILISKLGTHAKWFAEADSVEAYLLHEWSFDTTTAGFKTYKVESKLAKLNPEQIKTFKKIVGGKETYIFSSIAKKCEFAPRLAFVVKQKKQIMGYVMIATYCDVLQITDAQDSRIFIEDCDPGHQAIIQLGKNLFPNANFGTTQN